MPSRIIRTSDGMSRKPTATMYGVRVTTHSCVPVTWPILPMFGLLRKRDAASHTRCATMRAACGSSNAIKLWASIKSASAGRVQRSFKS